MTRTPADQARLFEAPAATVRSLDEQRRRRNPPPPSPPAPPALPGDLVSEFHASFGLPSSPTPCAHAPDDLVALRRRLLDEELEELREAIDARSIVDIADALGDLVYVLYGTALTFGINLDTVVAEIHRSNMSKLGSNGRPVMRSDGKVLKGPNYSPPDIAAALGRATDRELPLSWAAVEPARRSQ